MSGKDKGDAFEQMQQLLQRQVAAFTAGLEAMQQAWQGGEQSAAAQSPEPLGRLLERFGAASKQFWELQSQALAGFLADLPESQKQRFSSATFSQFEHLARHNWNRQFEHLAKQGERLLHQLSQVDAERLGELVASMMEEIGRDLASLGPADFTPNLEPLSRALGAVLGGAPDAESRRVVERLNQALVTKLKYGAEYYADPEHTAVGQTPRELVRNYGRFELWRYRRPEGVAPAAAPPVLLVYSVINKPYILDLVPGYSFVEHLLGRGLDVYLIEWGQTVPDDPTTLDDLIEPGITTAVQTITGSSAGEKVSLFGHCIGGNLALLYAALEPERVARIIALTTPITAARGGVVALWTDSQVFDVDRVVDEFGLMPAKLIRYTFMALKPYYEVMKWKMFLENLHDERVMALFEPVDRWANDNVDIPAEVFRKFIKEVFHKESFAAGHTTIHGRPARLEAITCPLMCLAADRDWIVPEDSARVLVDLVGSAEKEYVSIPGAHVGIMIDPRLRYLWDRMADFLLGKSAAGEN